MLKQKIKLMTDSVSDISKERAEAMGIHMLYFPVIIEGKSLREELDFSKEEFYDMIDRAQEYPSTAQLTPFEIMDAYEQLAAEGYTDLIYVTIGAGGSGTYNNAIMTREQYYEEHPESRMKIHVVDGRNYTATYGYAVAEAAKMLSHGANVPEIIDYIEDWVRHAGLYFVPMTLKYVKRSGRVSAAAAFAGELLGIKPFCRICNCESSVIQKIRGEQNMIPKMVEVVKADIQPHSPYIVMQASDTKIAQEFGAALTKALGYPPECYWNIGASICCNAGPHVFGFVIKRKEETV